MGRQSITGPTQSQTRQATMVTHTPRVNVEPPINLICMFLNWGSNLEYPERNIYSEDEKYVTFCDSGLWYEGSIHVIYAPAIFEDHFYPDLTKELLNLAEYELVLGGDMNAVCNLDLDRSTSSFTHSQQSASTALNTMIDNLDLFDVWRSQNPGSRDILVSLHIISRSQGSIIFCCRVV